MKHRLLNFVFMRREDYIDVLIEYGVFLVVFILTFVITLVITR